MIRRTGTILLIGIAVACGAWLYDWYTDEKEAG